MVVMADEKVGWASGLQLVHEKAEHVRAFTSVRGKDSVYFTQKTYFFYFTPLLLQNTYISLSILQDYSIKYSLFINFLLFSLMVILF